jgi:hypothetical protein
MVEGVQLPDVLRGLTENVEYDERPDDCCSASTAADESIGTSSVEGIVTAVFCAAEATSSVTGSKVRGPSGDRMRGLWASGDPTREAEREGGRDRRQVKPAWSGEGSGPCC